MKNRVAEILGIEKPIIQAPMAWITSPELVAAVSNAGGLGTLGFNAGFEKLVKTPEETGEEMRKSIRKTKELTDKPFALNIAPEHEDPAGFSKALEKVALEEGVPVIVIAGDVISPEEIQRLKKEGFKVIARELNPTVRGAKALEEAGADIIVATGADEGGCMPNGSTGTISITALLTDNVDIPVLAAGGIVNEKTARAAHAVDAEGAFVGSRFILSEESPSNIRTKEDLLNTHPDDMIVFTQWNGLSKWRSTPHTTAKEGLEENKKGNLNAGPGNFRASMLLGELEEGVNSANNVMSLVKEINTAEEIVNELSRGFEQ